MTLDIRSLKYPVWYACSDGPRTLPAYRDSLLPEIGRLDKATRETAALPRETGRRPCSSRPRSTTPGVRAPHSPSERAR